MARAAIVAAKNYLVICGCINPNIPEATGSEAEAPEYWLKGQICPCALLGLKGRFYVKIIISILNW